MATSAERRTDTLLELAARAHQAHLVLTPEEVRWTGLSNRVANPGSAYYRRDGWTANASPRKP